MLYYIQHTVEKKPLYKIDMNYMKGDIHEVPDLATSFKDYSSTQAYTIFFTQEFRDLS